VTLGELYFGAERSSRAEPNIERIDRVASSTTVLPCTQDTARQYGLVRNALRAKGRPIPENDIWIAATALEHGLILLTRDAHFRHVEGLTVEAW
jgi:tRNA(fMet)-specific endonuclease VapC